MERYSRDEMTQAPIGIDFAHHEIHDGDSFTCYFANTTSSNDVHRSAIHITTPSNGKFCHLIAHFAASAAAFLTIIEGHAVAANKGTSAVIYNRFRNSGNLSGVLDNATSPAVNKCMTLVEADIGTPGGTILRIEPLIVGVAPKPAGGSSRDSQELILKSGTKYLFMITNSGANANAHLIQLDWYEH